MTAVLVFAAGLVAGFCVRFGVLRALVRSRQRLADRLRGLEERFDAYRRADTRTDLDLVQLTPERGNRIYDQEATR